jgi:hypothetical protein
MSNILLKPPPLKMICSQALSGSYTVEPGLTCVAPTAVTKGHDAGKLGLNLIPSRWSGLPI